MAFGLYQSLCVKLYNIYIYIYIYIYLFIYFKRNLGIKLPTIWKDEKQRKEERTKKEIEKTGMGTQNDREIAK